MRYFLGILAGALGAALLYVALFQLSLGRAVTENAPSIAEWYRLKEEVAARTPSPRLLVVAGSNGLYGVDAAQLEEAIQLPAVNFSTHAALSLDYLLTRAQGIARPGDTILLLLEYEYYTSAAPNRVFTDFVLSAAPEYFRALPWKDQLFWMAAEPTEATLARLGSSQGSRESMARNVRERVESELDDHGSFTKNASHLQTPEKKEIVDGLGPLRALRPNLMKREIGWDRLGEFVEWCRAHDVRVLAGFPATVDFPEYHKRPARRALATIVENWEALGVPVIGRPEDFMMARENFFDTIYHLNHEAMSERTSRLARDLAPALARPHQ